MLKTGFAAAGFLLFALAAGAAPIPPKVKSSVASILVEDEKQPGKLRAAGTAFLLGVEVPGKIDRSVVYLVTAAHVLQRQARPTKPGGAVLQPTPDGVWLEHVYVRINALEGGSEVAELPIIGAHGEVLPLVASDDSVDLAAIRVNPDPNHLDYKMVVATMIATRDDFARLPIREGSDLFFVGLFSPRPGKSKILAMARFGRLALLPDEKIEWEGRAAGVYLIEAASSGEDSGAPVFYQPGADGEPGAVRAGNPGLKLVGVVQGGSRDPSSLGVTAVIPAYQLRDLLFSERAKQQRGF